MIKRLKNYVLDNDFRITSFCDKIDVLNYKEIDHFDDNKVIVRYENGMIVIKGDNLIISKLLDDELLINGKISNIEFR